MKYKTILLENHYLGGRPRAALGCHPGWGEGFVFDGGWGNGYVLISKEHPFYGLDYNIVTRLLNVHGGLTYSSVCDKNWIQKCSELDEDDLGCWILGFDTAHYQDTKEKWHKGAVQAEVDYLLTQVIALSNLTREEVIRRTDGVE